MLGKMQCKLFLMMLFCAVLPAAPVAVRYTEGLIHGFLELSSMEGQPLAHGDLIQVAANNRVTTRLVFKFKDGSLRDESAVFSQRGTFQLLSYHLVQNGPSFQPPMEMSFNSSSAAVTVRYTESDGKEKTVTEKLKLPPDVANGIIFTLLKNLRPDGPPTTVSMVASTPKPRLVKLVVTPQGEEPFSLGGGERKAMHYVIKVDIGGLSGVIAPLVGKQPPDLHVWILGGEAPAFVKTEGPLYYGGPIWRIELVSPVWPRR
jgi:hypothetical protein